MPTDTTTRTAATPLARLIRESGKSFRELAALTGVHHTSIHAIAQGRSEGSMPAVGKILEALGKRWADLDEQTTTTTRPGD